VEGAYCALKLKAQFILSAKMAIRSNVKGRCGGNNVFLRSTSMVSQGLTSQATGSTYIPEKMK